LLGSQHKDQLIVGTDTTRPPLIFLHSSGRDEQDMVLHAAELSSPSTAIAVRGRKVRIPLPVQNRIVSGGSASPLNQTTSKSIRRLFVCFLPGRDVAASSAMH
jgi:predicted esterase